MHHKKGYKHVFSSPSSTGISSCGIILLVQYKARRSRRLFAPNGPGAQPCMPLFDSMSLLVSLPNIRSRVCICCCENLNRWELRWIITNNLSDHGREGENVAIKKAACMVERVHLLFIPSGLCCIDSCLNLIAKFINSFSRLYLY